MPLGLFYIGGAELPALGSDLIQERFHCALPVLVRCRDTRLELRQIWISTEEREKLFVQSRREFTEPG